MRMHLQLSILTCIIIVNILSNFQGIIHLFGIVAFYFKTSSAIIRNVNIKGNILT